MIVWSIPAPFKVMPDLRSRGPGILKVPGPSSMVEFSLPDATASMSASLVVKGVAKAGRQRRRGNKNFIAPHNEPMVNDLPFRLKKRIPRSDLPFKRLTGTGKWLKQVKMYNTPFPLYLLPFLREGFQKSETFSPNILFRDFGDAHAEETGDIFSIRRPRPVQESNSPYWCWIRGPHCDFHCHYLGPQPLLMKEIGIGTFDREGGEEGVDGSKIGNADGDRAGYDG